MPSTSSTVITENLTVHYCDVFAEPDSGWQGVSELQIHELFKAAHDVVRQYQPQAKIVGPSIAVSSSEVAVVNGSVSSTLTNFKDGEAYIVTLKPVSR